MSNILPGGPPLPEHIIENAKEMKDDGRVIMVTVLGTLDGAEMTGDAIFPTDKQTAIAVLVADALEQLGFHR